MVHIINSVTIFTSNGTNDTITIYSTILSLLLVQVLLL